MSSITVSFTGNTSVLTSTFFPELTLDERYNYSCGLLDLTTYQSTPNVTHRNNKIYHEIKGKPVLEVPVGSYEAVDLLEYIDKLLKYNGGGLTYLINKNTLKTIINSTTDLSAEPEDSVFRVLGFRSLIKANTPVESEDVIKISKLNVIRVECNIVSGAYVNGRPSHSLYEFASNKVDVGYKIIEQPNNIIYLPVVPRRISCIQIVIVDQDGRPVDFRGEEISCRIHIKREDK